MPVGRPIGVGPIWVGPIGPSPGAAEGGDVTDTVALQLPVNCVLAGQQRVFDRYSECDIRRRGLKTKGMCKRSGTARLSGDEPSFRIRTDKKGYD